MDQSLARSHPNGAMYSKGRCLLAADGSGSVVFCLASYVVCLVMARRAIMPDLEGAILSSGRPDAVSRRSPLRLLQVWQGRAQRARRGSLAKPATLSLSGRRDMGPEMTLVTKLVCSATSYAAFFDP